MKKILLLTVVCLLNAATFACTNFLVGKKASTTGATMITYAADSYSLYGFLRFRAEADHAAGEMRKVYDWDTNKFLCEIPEIPHTYRVIGNMNEHQLTIGETTYGGRHELEQDSTGLIDYGSMIYIALERCRTAREAIECMTDLVAQYGYYSEGESFSIADPNEVWLLEMIGKGHSGHGAVWVATRIPDDCISAHANQARITTLPVKEISKASKSKKAKYYTSKDGNWMWSKDVITFAREKGYFKGNDEEFSFAEIYSPLDLVGAYGCEGRVWSFLRQYADDFDQYLPYVMGQSTDKMPLYIRPNRKLSANDLKTAMRDQYEGTPLSIRDAAGSGPYHTKLRHGGLLFKLDSVEYCYPRPTATQQTGWSFVSEMRSNAHENTGGIFWFGVDDASTNVYVPFYSCTNAVPECMAEGNGDMAKYSETSAFWAFNWVANWTYTKYDRMYPEVQRVQKAFEGRYDEILPALEKKAEEMSKDEAQKMLTDFSCAQATNAVAVWKDLFTYLMMRYMDGQEKKTDANVLPTDIEHVFLRTAEGEAEYPSRPAYPEEMLREIAPFVHH